MLNFNVPNDYFCIIFKIIYNCSAFYSSDFCISFNQERRSERIDRKLKTQIPNLSSSSQKVHMLHRAISRNRHYFSHKAQSTRNWKFHLGISCRICSGTEEIIDFNAGLARINFNAKIQFDPRYLLLFWACKSPENESLKFLCSEKATKIWCHLPVDFFFSLSKQQSNWKISPCFRGIVRLYKL